MEEETREQEIIETPAEVVSKNSGTINSTEEKIDKAAGVFVTIVLTVGQLLLAAVLVAFGLSAAPALSFTYQLVIKTFVFLIGIKCVIVGYSPKRL